MYNAVTEDERKQQDTKWQQDLENFKGKLDDDKPIEEKDIGPFI